MRLGIGSAGKAVVPVSAIHFQRAVCSKRNQYLWNAVSSTSMACPFARTPDSLRSSGLHGYMPTSQNRSSCSAAGSGGRKCSVVVFTVVVLRPSRSQAISKRRPIIQAIGPGAGHALAPGRIVVLAVAHVAHELNTWRSRSGKFVISHSRNRSRTSSGRRSST